MIDLGRLQAHPYVNSRIVHVGVISVFLLFAFTLFLSHNDAILNQGIHTLRSPPTWDSSYVNSTMTDMVRDLWAPLLHPVDAKSFTDVDGEEHLLSKPPLHTKKLGKRLCVLDVDSRKLDGEGQILNKEPQEWKKLRPLSAGVLAHYLYAMIHGYEYRYIHAPTWSDRDPRFGTWVKVVMMKEALKEFDVVVFMDSDAHMTNMELPVEWLMNYWDIHKNIMVAMAYDPDEPQNFDPKGNIYLNTGFVIAQRSRRTQQMYKTWAECPLELHYKDCANYRTNMFHEQSAFGRFVRYDFKSGIRDLPCAEANGCPEAINRGKIGGCKGTFVRHYWHDKSLALPRLAQVVMQAFIPRLHAQFNHLRGDFMIDARGFTLEGSDVYTKPLPSSSSAEKEADNKEEEKKVEEKKKEEKQEEQEIPDY